MWKAEPHHLWLLIQAVCNVIPIPSNLFSWGLVMSPACNLCLKRGGPWNSSSAAVQKPWVRGATAGTTSKSWRPYNTPSAVELATPSTSVKGRPPLLSFGLWRSQGIWQDVVESWPGEAAENSQILSPIRSFGLTCYLSQGPPSTSLSQNSPYLGRNISRRPLRGRRLVVVQHRGGKRGVREVGCRGFTDQSLCMAYILEIMEASKQRAIKEVIEAVRWLWIRKGELWVG